MPIHDWTRVDAGIFHDFHHEWISEIKRVLNRGLLPTEFYALAEQIAGGFGPDVLTLQKPLANLPDIDDPKGGVALETAPPKVRFRARSEPDQYATKAKSVVIRHTSKHEVIAVVEIVSPGNKNSQDGIRAFRRKAEKLLRGGIHLLILDLHPPGKRDPRGIHPLIWGKHREDEFVFTPEKPLTLAAYVAGTCREAFVEPVAVGDVLPEMPLFLTQEVYIPVPLEAAYQSAWQEVPSFWRDVIAGP